MICHTLFCSQLGNISQNLLYVAVVIGALRVVKLLFLMVPWVCLHCVSVVLTSHIHLFFVTDCLHLIIMGNYMPLFLPEKPIMGEVSVQCT